MVFNNTVLQENFNYLKKGYLILFKNKFYYFVVFVVFVVFFLFSVWNGNIGTIFDLVFSSQTSFDDKLNVLYSFTSSISTNFSTVNAILLSLVSAFLGLNFTLIIFYLKRRIISQNKSTGAVGIFGVLGAVIGMGCSACGFALILPILAFFGISGALTALPLYGGEVYIVSLILIMISCFLLMKKISQPFICPVD